MCEFLASGWTMGLNYRLNAGIFQRRMYAFSGALEVCVANVMGSNSNESHVWDSVRTRDTKAEHVLLGSGECEKSTNRKTCVDDHMATPFPHISMLQDGKVFESSEKKYHLREQAKGVERATLKLGGKGK